MRDFVDVHSHMAPSGDDGVKTREEGLDLLRETHRRGTAVQYATPHVNRVHPWSPPRAARVQDALAWMRPRAAAFGLDLRLGYELTPEPWQLHADLRDYRMERLDACLIELPLPHTRARDLELLEPIGERMEASGLRPILAHPERCQLVWDDLGIARAFAARGWLLQVNASSLLGHHRVEDCEVAWKLLREGLCDLIASDGHRAARPPYLDAIHAAVAADRGAAVADRLCCGDALEPLAAAA
jgi:protein-tyrosine phosphatase